MRSQNSERASIRHLDVAKKKAGERRAKNVMYAGNVCDRKC